MHCLFETWSLHFPTPKPAEISAGARFGKEILRWDVVGPDLAGLRSKRIVLWCFSFYFLTKWPPVLALLFYGRNDRQPDTTYYRLCSFLEISGAPSFPLGGLIPP